MADSSGELSRRDLLRQIGVYLAVTGASCAGCNTAFGQWPGGGSGTGSKTGNGWPSSRSPSGGSYKRREPGPAAGSSRLAVQGCALSAKAASAFGRNGIRLLSEFGTSGARPSQPWRAKVFERDTSGTIVLPWPTWTIPKARMHLPHLGT